MRYIDLDKKEVRERDPRKWVYLAGGFIFVAWFAILVVPLLLGHPGGTTAAIAAAVTQVPLKDPGVTAAVNASSRNYILPPVTPVTRCVDGGPCSAPVTVQNLTLENIRNVTQVPVVTSVPFFENQSGIRNLSQLYTIHRENVSGYKDLTVNTTVYGWKAINQVKWYSDYWGSYIDQFAPNGQEYIFVYLVEYVDGTTPHEDPRTWYFSGDLFRLQVGDYFYDQDRDFSPVVRVKEMESVTGYNGIKGLVPFGYYIDQRSDGNKTAIEDPWLKMGVSNARDGYLVFQVPKDSDPSKMILVGSFGSFGSVGWRLR